MAKPLVSEYWLAKYPRGYLAMNLTCGLWLRKNMEETETI